MAIAGLRHLVASGAAWVDLPEVDRWILAIDRALATHLDRILHSPELRAIEARWRGLAFVVERLRFDEGIRLEILAASADELADDFADAPEIAASGLHRLVYSEAIASHGGVPYALLCGDFTTPPTRAGLDLLRSLAAVAAHAQAPFVGNVGAAFVGARALHELAGLADLEALVGGPVAAEYAALRRHPDARHLALCLPRLLLRPPHDVDTTPGVALPYRESIADEDELCWGNASLALVVRVAESFARYRWAAALLGSERCGVIAPPEALARTPGLPVDLLVSRRCELALAAVGLTAMVYDRDAGGLTFTTAPTLADPDALGGEGGDPCHQLAYVLIAARVTHYLRRIQRDQVGAWEDPRALTLALRTWLRGHVADVDAAHWETRARRPFRRATLRVDRRADGRWVRAHLELEPHFTHHGAPITLTTIGRLDPSGGPSDLRAAAGIPADDVDPGAR
ncbi:MAG: type VI secretion system contractile sheath large subunit [Myxococcales bacterium]|nr:type VI secretion system contractile sheath large subunit [Myxococcales bacterium]